MLEHICHRIPERSFLWLWNPPVLCARCTGFYLGIVVAIILQLLVLRWTKISLGLVIPAAVIALGEVAVEWLWHIDLGNSIRCLTAIPLGFVVGVGLIIPLISYSYKKRNSREKISNTCGS